jgi:hypothetical protein
MAGKLLATGMAGNQQIQYRKSKSRAPIPFTAPDMHAADNGSMTNVLRK